MLRSAIMHKWKLIPLLATILNGCTQQSQLPSDLRLAVLTVGMKLQSKPDPKLRVRHPGPGEEDLLERQKVLETLRLYSSSWWVVHDEIEAARLCRDCEEVAISNIFGRTKTTPVAALKTMGSREKSTEMDTGWIRNCIGNLTALNMFGKFGISLTFQSYK